MVRLRRKLRYLIHRNDPSWKPGREESENGEIWSFASVYSIYRQTSIRDKTKAMQMKQTIQAVHFFFFLSFSFFTPKELSEKYYQFMDY